jgi:hypothetical protein
VPQNIAAGGSYTCSITEVVPGNPGDVVTNTATASGTDNNGNPVSATDTADVTLTTEEEPPVPALSLVKSLQGNADEDGSGDVTLGDTLTYGFVATNIGNVELTGVTITDPLPSLSALACTPTQPAPLAPTEAISCTATYVVTAADVTAGAINNTATADSDQTDPVDDNETVSVLPAQFVCTGEAFIIQEALAQLYQVDQSVDPFTFTPIGGTSDFEINNLGFDAARGILWGWHRTSPDATSAQEIVTIDANGTVTPMGNGGLPDTVRFNAGDVSPDGSRMYLNRNGGGLIYTVGLPGLAVQSNPQMTITRLSGTVEECSTDPVNNPCGRVSDWAAHPTNGLLYGGKDTDDNHKLAVLDPTTGDRRDYGVGGPGIGTSTLGFGAAWFNAAGELFLYNNDGTIYTVDINDCTDPSLDSCSPVTVEVQSGGPTSQFNDGAACAAGPAIELIKTADPTSVIVGGEVTYTFTVNNLSINDTVTINSLDDSIYGDLNGLGDCSVDQILPVGGSYTCSVTEVVPGSAGQTITNTATASGTSDGGTPVSDDDTADVELLALPQGTVSGHVYEDTNDNGVQPQGTVSGHVYEDTNDNGVQDSGEPNLPGVDVVITDSLGNTQTVTTDANGDYTATAAPPPTWTRAPCQLVMWTAPLRMIRTRSPQ